MATPDAKRPGSTLTQLRALQITRSGSSGGSMAQSFVGDDMLQAELDKIDKWMLLSQVNALIAARRIANRWRAHMARKQQQQAEEEEGGGGGGIMPMMLSRAGSSSFLPSPRRAFGALGRIKNRLFRAGSVVEKGEE